MIEIEEGPHYQLGHGIAQKAEYLLEVLQPYPGDPANVLQSRGRRFLAHVMTDEQEVLIHDRVLDTFVSLKLKRAINITFPIGEWYADLRSAQTGAPLTNRASFQTCVIVDPYCWNARKVLESGIPYPWDDPQRDFKYHRFEVLEDDKKVQAQIDDLSIEGSSHDNVTYNYEDIIDLRCLFELNRPMNTVEQDTVKTTACHGQYACSMGLYGQQIPTGTYPSVQRNASNAKDPSQKIPKPLVIVVKINGKPACALVDSGSLGDFISSTLVQQLRIQKKELTSPVPVQLAVQGSRSQINFGATARFQYQTIAED
ncbi:hypothetical protein C0993_011670 [Termitomyces sp. T159_Od127]|nr:hypothetical protein C0993_011670 [Termitomyces sp. T159_Od127]